MDQLFSLKAKKEARGEDLNSGIQSKREYRNPRICEKLIESCNIKQYGSNLPKNQFDPDGWKQKPESFYDSRMYRQLADQREREKISSKNNNKQASNWNT